MKNLDLNQMEIVSGGGCSMSSIGPAIIAGAGMALAIAFPPAAGFAWIAGAVSGMGLGFSIGQAALDCADLT